MLELSWENDMKPMVAHCRSSQTALKNGDSQSSQQRNFTIPWGFHGITRVFATHFPQHSYQVSKVARWV